MFDKKKIKIAFLSTWPELTDGISTFCENLTLNLPKSYKNYSIDWSVIRVKWLPQKKVLYSNKILTEISFDKKEDYKKAAELINNSNIDLVVIQFINAIYGDGGNMILEFIDNVKKPILVVLHSVAMLKEQSGLAAKQALLKQFAIRNIEVVTMTKAAENFLVDDLKFKSTAVNQIYHGAPEFKKISTIEKVRLRKKLGFSQTDKIVFTYGVLREDKGIEEIIKSIKIIQKDNTNVKLLLAGAEQTTGYIAKIKKIILNLNLDDKIIFINKFIPQEDIGKYLQISDIYITAQRNLGLHSSGTLAYALSAGSVVISTPTIHAKEFLKKAGSIVPVKNPNAIAKAVLDLLADDKDYKSKKRASEILGKNILWPKVSKEYLDIAFDLVK
ncbi:MAG: glycosyltransferase [Patescibacteria group bacterium]|jgi:glycosyltransferase involved in cell wall biosynthesis